MKVIFCLSIIKQKIKHDSKRASIKKKNDKTVKMLVSFNTEQFKSSKRAAPYKYFMCRTALVHNTFKISNVMRLTNGSTRTVNGKLMLNWKWILILLVISFDVTIA